MTACARIVTTAAEAERLARRLEAAFDDDGFPVTRLEVEDDGAWAVEVLFADVAEATERMAAALGAEAAAAEISELEERDWVAAGLEGLGPVAVGRFVVHGTHDRGRATAPIAIQIDAGLAFGTGHHETTVGCLAAIDALLKRRRPRRVLDLGTGTAVLAIAVAKAARVAVAASDIDPVAVEVARRNAIENGVGPWVRPVTAAGLDHPALRGGRWDLVIANILARPLIRLAPQVAAAVVPGGTLVLSGLRTEDGRRVLAAYRAHGLVLGRRDPDGRWLTLTLERPRRPGAWRR